MLLTKEAEKKCAIPDVVELSEQLADHQCKFYVNADWTKLKCECGKEQLPKAHLYTTVWL